MVMTRDDVETDDTAEAMEAGTWEGTVALVNRETRESIGAAVMFTVTDSDLVYLMQPADRSAAPHIMRAARPQGHPLFLERVLAQLRRHCRLP